MHRYQTRLILSAFVSLAAVCAVAQEPLRDERLDFALQEGISPAAYEGVDYSERLRPQFHFSSARNWINDPNGMVFDGTQFHLFFQHNPLAPVWGNMTWGHATSRDMVRWTQHDHALLPYRVDGRSGTVYSGTAVVDHNNSLGVQRGDVKTLCAFFTFASEPAFYQAMAYSTDRGATWTYWDEGRPILPNQGFDAGERDPKVFWHEPTRRWVLALWVQQNPGRVRFFVSENLTDWEHASDLMRDWAFECMDLVYLSLDGDPDNVKAVLYDASFDYEVGRFDGRAFHTEAGPYVASGGAFYAAQTFNDAPDGRVVQIGWMRGGPNWAEAYGLPANQQMAFPCELSLRTVVGEPRLFVWPVEEIEGLVESESVVRGVEVTDSRPHVGVEPLELVDVLLTLEPGEAERVTIEAAAATYTYDAARRELRLAAVDDSGAEREVVVARDLVPREGAVSLRLLVDRLSAETFAFGGEQCHAAYVAPREPRPIAVRAEGGRAVVRSLEVRRLGSIWGAEGPR